MSERPEERIRIHIDEDLLSLVPGFLQNRKQDIGSILAAVDRGDFETVRRLGHSMKGCGGGYGFDGITEIGAAIEEAAKRANSEDVRSHVIALEHYLGRVEIVGDCLPSV